MAKNIQNNTNNTQTIILSIVAILLLVIGTAAASVYFARSSTPEPAKVAVIQQPARHVVRHETVTTRQVAVAQPCNDGNIVGKGLGGIAGGALASNVGKGKGQTAATIAGTLGGAYVGGDYIPTSGVTCR